MFNSTFVQRVTHQCSQAYSHSDMQSSETHMWHRSDTAGGQVLDTHRSSLAQTDSTGLHMHTYILHCMYPRFSNVAHALSP
jgi:hypothetical protein